MTGLDIISEKSVYKSKYFEVKEKEVILPNKKKKKYSIVERKPISVIFPITPKKEIYIISQYRTLFDKRIMEAIAGHTDGNETPLEAAKRELMEETGISARQWEEVSRVETSASVIKSTMSIFLAKELDFDKPNPDETESIELRKVTIDEALKMISEGEIRTAATMIGIYTLDRLRRQKRL
ncbi:MAG TPA: NUDIX hydrolase [Patescibacteria group bacterium]|nr:NUDIX hydrolase [Patescibacteria group bacterium]